MRRCFGAAFLLNRRVFANEAMNPGRCVGYLILANALSVCVAPRKTLRLNVGDAPIINPPMRA